MIPDRLHRLSRCFLSLEAIIPFVRTKFKNDIYDEWK